MAYCVGQVSFMQGEEALGMEHQGRVGNSITMLHGRVVSA